MAQAVRLFVSSTFLDMQAERDALARLCFPQVRRVFAAEGRPFVEIDLRWGLRVGESEERIVELCLQEVSRCKGFFVGILGSRYGYVPESVPEQAALLNAESGTSITEYEILAGAFAAPLNSFVRLYFRGDGHDDEPSMCRLKAKIRALGLPVRTYEKPDELALLLKEDLQSLAVERANPSTALQVVDGIATLQADGTLMLPRAHASLQAWWEDGLPRLCLVAPEGAGKTTLLAQWIQSLRGASLPKPESSGWRRYFFRETVPVRPLTVAVHFAGTHLSESGLSRTVESLHAQLMDGAASPPAHGSLAQRLLQWHAAVLAACERGESVLLVLDGMDLVLHQSHRGLEWLPPHHPQLRVLVSTRRPVESLERGHWGTLELSPLNPRERVDVLQAQLLSFGKSLDPEHMESVQRTLAIGTPAELRLLAEELRLLGSPEQVTAFVQRVSNMPDVVALGSTLLARLENEIGAELVRDACAFLAVSRGGLPEGELRALLQSGHAITGARWSALMQGFRMSIFDQNGRLGLFDPTVRAAAMQRYGLGEDRVEAWRERLVAHHLAELGDGQHAPPRMLEELSWQLEHMQDWVRLRHFARQASFSAAFWRHEPEACKRVWRVLTTHHGESLVDRAAAWRTAVRVEPAQALDLALLLLELGRADLATTLLPLADDAASLKSRINVAALLLEQGSSQAALQRLGEVSESAEEATPITLVAWGLRGNAMHALGRSEEALMLHQRCVAAWESAGQALAAAHSRHNQALCCIRLQRWHDATELLTHCVPVFQRAHDQRAWVSSQITLAEVRFAMGHEAEALTALRRAQDLAHDGGDSACVAQAMAGRGRILEASGQRDAADAVQLQRQMWCERHGDAPGALMARLDRVAIRMNLGPRGLRVAAGLLRESLSWAKAQEAQFGPDIQDHVARLAASLGVEAFQEEPATGPMADQGD